MSSIKLLALDLDGTLVDSEGNIPKANIEALRKAEDKGVVVTIATGRRYRDALPMAVKAGLQAPFLSHNGGLTKIIEGDQTVHVDLIPSEIAMKVVESGRDADGDALVSADPLEKGTMYFESISGENEPLRKYVEWAKRLHGDDADKSVLKVDSLDETVNTREVIHISFSGRCEPMRILCEHLNEDLEDSVNILATIYPHLDFTLLDVLPKGVSKAAGLDRMCAENGITKDEVMAVGDNFNDLEMLEFAGLGVVMGNAEDELLSRQEFYKTVSNNEAGVAAAVEEFILEN